MSGERGALLAQIRAAAEAGARAALAAERQRCDDCANFAALNSKEALAHASAHRSLDRFYIPLVEKMDARTVNFFSMAFFLALALVVFLFFAEARQVAAIIFPSSQGGKQ